MRSKDLISMIAAGALLGCGAALTGCEEGTMEEGTNNVREGVDETTDDINRGIDDAQDDLDTTTTPRSTPNQTNPNTPTTPPPEEDTTTTP